MQKIKCVVVGDGDVGKTTLMKSYQKNEIPQGFKFSFESYLVTVQIGGSTYTLDIFDTQGQEMYDSLRKLCYLEADVILICFSVIYPDSFMNVRDVFIPEIGNHIDKIPIVLVGTKIDLRKDNDTLKKLAEKNQKPIQTREGKELAEEIMAVNYIECSAITQEGLKDVFGEAALAALTSEKFKQPIIKKSSKCTIC